MPRYYSSLLTITILFIAFTTSGNAGQTFTHSIKQPLNMTKPLQFAPPEMTFSSNPQSKISKVSITQLDEDEDGTPEITILDTSFYSPKDRIIVLDGAQNMVWGDDPYLVTDFTDDVWIFDAGADGTAQLIVDFNVQEGKYIALVYDDMNGDGRVSYNQAGDQVIIDESNYWHVKVETSHPWKEAGGLFDTNVTFYVDANSTTKPGMSSTKGNDGIVDYEINIGDKNGDGINDYYLNDKSIVYVQAKARKPTPYTNIVFWPLLVSKHAYEEYRYFDHPPVMAIDWQTGTIDRMGILGYPIEDGYHIYSWLSLEKGMVNAANFENPMAYWDMANDQDGWPELQVRFQEAIANDPYFPSYPKQGSVKTPNVEVNYSWDQNNDNRWDYKINLNANYSIDEVVDFPDFAVKSVPYEELIPWVRNRSWDIAMLIFDGSPSQDSEGMFGKGWMIDRGYYDGESVEPAGVSTQYMVGFSDQPPYKYYQDIQEFMRGEYNFQYFDTPKVYLSSLDRQLHLYKAQSGVWNLGDGKYVRYANLDGDAYLDQWMDEQDGNVIQQLNYNDGFFVYNGNSSVVLKQTKVEPAVFETQPPGSNKEWLTLDAQLKASQATLSPTDFTGMLAQMDGSAGSDPRRECARLPTHCGGFPLRAGAAAGIRDQRTRLAGLAGAGSGGVPGDV